MLVYETRCSLNSNVPSTLRHMSFQPLFWTSLAAFTVGCLQNYYERGQNKNILSKFETRAQLLTKKMIAFIYHSVLLPSVITFKVYTILFILMKTVKLLLFLTIQIPLQILVGRFCGILQNSLNQWFIQMSARKAT